MDKSAVTHMFNTSIRAALHQNRAGFGLHAFLEFTDAVHSDSISVFYPKGTKSKSPCTLIRVNRFIEDFFIKHRLEALATSVAHTNDHVFYILPYGVVNNVYLERQSKDFEIRTELEDSLLR